MANIVCADAQHASRSASPGWVTVLGTGDKDDGTLVCAACQAARDGAAVDGTNAMNTITVRRDGAYMAAKMTVYQGQIYSQRVGTGLVNNVLDGTTPVNYASERAALLALLTKLWNAVV